MAVRKLCTGWQKVRDFFIGVKGETNMSAGVSITVSYIMKTTKSETQELASKRCTENVEV